MRNFVRERVANRCAVGATPSEGNLTAAGAETPASSRRQTRARFHCVNDGAPDETIRLLREACERREVEFVEVNAPLFDYAPERRLTAGDLLYRPAVSVASMRVEQFLFNEGVATFYSKPDVMAFTWHTQSLTFERAGLPIPPTVFCSTTSRGILRGYVERLGGFPIVMKMMGGEGGVGVMRVDSFPALFSQMDYARACGSHPLLCAFIDNAVHWRLVVVGDRVAAGYRNLMMQDDFRTYTSDDLSDYPAPIQPEMADIAVRAARAIKLEFSGVDLLQTPSGRIFALEANFPCYFPQAQLVAGVDISGMMIDHLLEKARKRSTVDAGPQVRTLSI